MVPGGQRPPVRD